MAICQSKVIIILVPSCGTHHTSKYEHRPTYLASYVGKIVPVYYRTVISSSCNRRLSQLVVGTKQAQTSKLNAMSNQQRPSIFVLRNDEQQSSIQSREENETKRAARYIIAILSQDFLIPHAFTGIQSRTRSAFIGREGRRREGGRRRASREP